MTDTTNLGLHKPAAGDASWDTPLNANADTLDAQFAASGTAHSHNGTAGKGPKLAQSATHEIPDTDAGPTSLHHTLGTGANQAAAGNDSRLSNSRTPTAHASTHASGGSDPVSPASIGAEPGLGNPGTSGYVLSSTTGGARSWIAPATGGGTGSTYVQTAAPSSPATGALWLDTDAVASGGGAATPYIRALDSEASGTNGGASTAGSWVTRTLNTKSADTGALATLATNQLTLPAGTYRVLASAPAYSVNSHMARLRDITNGADLVLGTTEFCNGTIQTRSVVAGRFTLAGTTVVEVQHRASTTTATFGLGVSCAFGVAETYAVLELWKEA